MARKGKMINMEVYIKKRYPEVFNLIQQFNACCNLHRIHRRLDEEKVDTKNIVVDSILKNKDHIKSLLNGFTQDNFNYKEVDILEIKDTIVGPNGDKRVLYTIGGKGTINIDIRKPVFNKKFLADTEFLTLCVKVRTISEVKYCPIDQLLIEEPVLWKVF